MTEIGRRRGGAPGATLIVVGGIHGNEPAGVVACRGLLGRLDAAPLGAGEVIALAGNPPALAAGRRQLARDLNRQWTPELIAAARAKGDRGDAEERALVALAGAIDAAVTRARGPVFVLDLHTSSSEGVPFVFVGGGEAERAFAASLPIPGIAGVHSMLPGVLVNHLAARGCLALAVEGGQSESAEAVANLDAVLAIALVATGLAGGDARLEEARALLVRARGDLPQLIEVVRRHQVDPAGAFRMEPGFRNISRTPAGTLLAHEHGRPILADRDGYVLLPLYQSQGEDGFFYGVAR